MFGTHIDRFFRHGVLLDMVYELLGRDLQLAFRDQLWGWHRQYGAASGMPGALRRI